VIDIEKHVEYWRSGAREDWAVATELVDRGRVRHGLFIGHLALEKALKVLVCRHTLGSAATHSQPAAPD